MVKFLTRAIATFLVIAPVSAFGYDLSFTMVNNTDQPIVRLWTSVTTSSTWAEATNIYVPANGQSQDISFPNEASGSDCYIDLKFQFKGGTVKQIGHIDLCYIVSVTIDVDDDGTVTYKLSHK